MIFFFLWPFEVHISVKVTSNCGIGVWKNNIIGDITFESSSISNYAKAVVVILQNVIKYVFVLIKKFHRNNKAVTVWKQHLNRVRTIISNQCLFKKVFGPGLWNWKFDQGIVQVLFLLQTLKKPYTCKCNYLW